MANLREGHVVRVVGGKHAGELAVVARMPPSEHEKLTLRVPKGTGAWGSADAPMADLAWVRTGGAYEDVLVFERQVEFAFDPQQPWGDQADLARALLSDAAEDLRLALLFNDRARLDEALKKASEATHTLEGL